MRYRIIHALFKKAKDRFYRVVAVREDLDLEKVGIVLCTALGAEFEHMFMIISNGKCYCDESWVDGPMYADMAKHHLDDLGGRFDLVYDTGEDWIFSCVVSEKAIEHEGKEVCSLIDGAGQGIWEDNKDSLMRYLEGEISPDQDEEDEDRGIRFPWNKNIERFSDFDTDFDLEYEKEVFSDLVEDNFKMYEEGKKMMRSSNEEEIDPEINEEDIAKAKEEFVDMQINNYFLIRDMLEEFHDKYPKESEEKLLKRCRKELLIYAEDMFDDLEFYMSGAEISDDIH